MIEKSEEFYLTPLFLCVNDYEKNLLHRNS